MGESAHVSQPLKVHGCAKEPDCTARDTSTCLLSKELTACEFVRFDTAEEPANLPSKNKRQFHTGLELGLDEARTVMRARDTTVVGVFGQQFAGKTCLLSSVYLLLAHGLLLPEFSFAGSLSLEAFERRVRKVREWKEGAFPEKLSDHTKLDDERQPALLHMRVKGADEIRDILITDLPGEWTKKAADRSDFAKKLGFLPRCDAFIYVVDGELLSGSERRVQLNSAELFLDRISSLSPDPGRPFVVAVSKCDKLGGLEVPEFGRTIAEHAESLGFVSRGIATSSFSSIASVPSGSGVSEILRSVLLPRPPLIPRSEIPRSRARSFLQFRAR